MSGRPSATICVILLLVGIAIGLRASLGQNTSAAIARTTTDIVVDGADYTSTIATENSSALINIAQNVTPRFITEYADFGHRFALQESDTLNQAADVVQPRVIIEYADYAATLTLSSYVGPLPSQNDTSLPSIVMTREPSGPEVNVSKHVIVSANVTDVESGVKNATLQYTLNNSTDWSSAYQIPMSLDLTLHPQNSLALSFNATIPEQSAGTRVRFRVVAYDFAGNNAIVDGVIDTATYIVVPEFPSAALLSLFMTATLSAVAAYRRRRSRARDPTVER